MRPQSPQETDPMLALGIVFVGAGVALSVTLGPFMAGMVLIGLVMLVRSALSERSRRRDRSPR